MTSKTTEINLLLEKVERSTKLADATLERMNKPKFTLKDFNFPESLQWYVDLRNKHQLSFKFPKYRAMKESEIEIREKLEHSMPWDNELFSLLSIKLDFYGNSWKHYGGACYGQYIHINSYYSYDMYAVVAHEIGHAYHFQLARLTSLDENYLAKQVMDVVFKELGGIVSGRSFRSYCLLLKKYISNYSTKNIDEAFAEIFMYAYSKETTFLFQKEERVVKACQKGIDHFYKLIKLELYKKFML